MNLPEQFWLVPSDREGYSFIQWFDYDTGEGKAIEVETVIAEHWANIHQLLDERLTQLCVRLTYRIQAKQILVKYLNDVAIVERIADELAKIVSN